MLGITVQQLRPVVLLLQLLLCALCQPQGYLPWLPEGCQAVPGPASHSC